MLAFFGLLLVFSFTFDFFYYSWCLSVVFFFIYSFYSFFFFMGYGWAHVDVISSFSLLSVGLVCLSVWMSGLMCTASWSLFLRNSFDKKFLFCIFSLCFILLGCFSFDNFFYFYVFFEASLVPTFFLVLGWGYQPERLGAGMYMVIYTVGASLPLLGCLLYCFEEQGHLSFLLFFSFNVGSLYVTKVFFFFVILAFFVKVPVFFFHLWLPKAHVEAPVAGSMILAGVLLKLGGYGLFRVGSKFSFLLSGQSYFYVSVVLWGGVITGFICLRQVDLKGLIAYSSVGHMGLFVSGVFSNNVWGWQGGFLMLLGHGLCSPAMFALANITYESVGSRSMVLSKGLLSVFPFVSFLWFLICSSNMAAPPSLNLLAEVMLLVSVCGAGWFWSLFLGFLSFLGGAYSLYMYVGTQHGGLGSFYGSFLPVKLRCYFLVFCHWLPLNLIFLSAFCFTDWVF